MTDTYTHLLEIVAETADGGIADKAVVQLVAHLEATGKIKMLPQILKELRKIAVRRRNREPQLEVASEKEKETAVKEVQRIGINPKSATVNPLLIRGWRVRHDGILIDHSAKDALVQIYQKVTA